MIGIYAIRNRKNKKLYIGESLDIGERWRTHLKHLSENAHHSYLLQQDWNEFGCDAFSFHILEDFTPPLPLKTNYLKTKLALICREHYYMEKYDTLENGYNIEDTYNKTYDGIYPTDLEKVNKDLGGMLKYFTNRNSWLITDEYTKSQLLLFIKDKKADQKDKDDKESKQVSQKDKPVVKSAEKIVKETVTEDEPKKEKKSSFDYKEQNLVSAKELIDCFDSNFIDKYSPYVVFYAFKKMGYMIYAEDGHKNKWRATDKGVSEGYFVTNNKPNTYKTYWTQKGVGFAKYISIHLSEFVSDDELCESNSTKDGEPIVKLKVKPELYENTEDVTQ